MNPEKHIIDRLRAEGKSRNFIEGYLAGVRQFDLRENKHARKTVRPGSR